MNNEKIKAWFDDVAVGSHTQDCLNQGGACICGHDELKKLLAAETVTPTSKFIRPTVHHERHATGFKYLGKLMTEEECVSLLCDIIEQQAKEISNLNFNLDDRKEKVEDLEAENQELKSQIEATKEVLLRR